MYDDLNKFHNGTYQLLVSPYTHNTGKFLNIKMICRMLLGYCITVAVKGEFV